MGLFGSIPTAEGETLTSRRAARDAERAVPTFAPDDPMLSAMQSAPTVARDERRPSESPALVGMKKRLSEELFTRIGSRMSDPDVTEEELALFVRQELSGLIDEQALPLSGDQREQFIDHVLADSLGLGPLERMLEDEGITEIMVNGPDQVYVERKGKLTLEPVKFESEEQLRKVIERIVSKVGRRIDESSPYVDARLEDGSRVHAIIPPLSIDGSTLTIRKFSKDPLRIADLLSFGTLTPEMADFLEACILARLNIIISGGTGTGKTTMLNVLSSFIPDGERIVTIEDAAELQLQKPHVRRLESRPANTEGKGEVTIRELLKNSLRMRPDRIVVGEVRSGETLDMLQAMNTGHDGSLSTTHSNTPRDAVARLETLVMMAGMDLPLAAIRSQIASAVDLVIQVQRLRDGSRRITHVTEVQGMEGDRVTLQDVFLFDFDAGVDENGRFKGTTRATGVRPKFAQKFDDYGIQIAADVFRDTRSRF